MNKKQTICLIVAAGSGSRINSETPKQYIDIAGVPLICHTAQIFINHPLIDDVYIIYNPVHEDLYNKATKNLKLNRPIIGGKTRQESVYLGLKAINHLHPDKVLIHDAARPFVSANMISDLIKLLDKVDAVIPVLKVSDTLKENKDGKIIRTIDRSNLVQAQTPQAFKYKNILQSHIKLSQYQFTDDAALEEYQEKDVATINGEIANFKITTNDDLIRAKNLMSNVKSKINKVGIGFDVHKFCTAKKQNDNFIMLCGIKVPYEKSLAGHSDADVAIHAVVDAILGAIGQGDIGDHFPPSDNKYKGIQSEFFLKEAHRLTKEQNGTIINIDVTIICEEPKLSSYKMDMAKQLAKILQIKHTQVNVKATTTEKLGFTGRGEGIATQAIANIELLGV